MIFISRARSGNIHYSISRDLQSYHSVTEGGVFVGRHYGADGNAYIKVCRMKKEAADTVLSLVATAIKENCIDGRWRSVLNMDRNTKTAPVKLHFECFVYQLRRLPGCDGSKPSTERIINLAKRIKYIYFMLVENTIF